MTQPPADWILLDDGLIQAAVDPQGAQLSMLRDPSGRDLLWHGDPAWWSGRAPILFPIVGALSRGSYRHAGATHELPRHGFARGRRFQVMDQDAASVCLRLVDDAQTRAVFPFAFELDVRFRVAHAALYCVATVRNRGETAMPASLGFHPAFRWPLQGAGPREGHQIRFAQTEPAAVRRLDAQGLLRPLSESSPVQGRILSLDDALFEKDVVIFDRLESRSLRYADESGSGIDIEFPDASYLGVWTRPGAPFVCIEPWRGIADPQGFDGDLADKPGVELLAGPGDSFDLTMVLKLRTAVLEPGDA